MRYATAFFSLFVLTSFACFSDHCIQETRDPTLVGRASEPVRSLRMGSEARPTTCCPIMDCLEPWASHSANSRSSLAGVPDDVSQRRCPLHRISGANADVTMTLNDDEPILPTRVHVPDNDAIRALQPWSKRFKRDNRRQSVPNLGQRNFPPEQRAWTRGPTLSTISQIPLCPLGLAPLQKNNAMRVHLSLQDLP